MNDGATTLTGALEVFGFDHDHGAPARSLVDTLGGKGAGLAEMTTALGLPVPPGFTIGVGTCRRYLAAGWPDGLDDVLDRRMPALGRMLGRDYADPADPLLVAVRSGAPRAAADLGPEARTDDPDAACAEITRIRRHCDVPQDPTAQLRAAIEAVFRSCGSERARAYAAREGWAGDVATAVNVQAMVFGNRGPDSGTGVVFTRDPSTGEARRRRDLARCGPGNPGRRGRRRRGHRPSRAGRAGGVGRAAARIAARQRPGTPTAAVRAHRW